VSHFEVGDLVRITDTPAAASASREARSDVAKTAGVRTFHVVQC